MTTTLLEDIRSLVIQVERNDYKTRDAKLTLGERLEEMRGTYHTCDRSDGQVDNLFGKALKDAGIILSKDLRADALKMARAVSSGEKTRDEVLALSAREVRMLGF